MQGVSPVAHAIATWGTRAIFAQEQLAGLLQALTQSEVQRAQLVDDLAAAKAAGGAGEALRLRMEAEYTAIQGCIAAAGLAWNPEKSTVANVENAFAWLHLALSQERDTVASLRIELHQALGLANEGTSEGAAVVERLTDELEALKASHAETIATMERVLDRQVRDYELRIEELRKSSDGQHMETLQNEVIRLNDELAAARKAPARVEAPEYAELENRVFNAERAAKDAADKLKRETAQLLRLVDALGATDYATAFRRAQELGAKAKPRAIEAPAASRQARGRKALQEAEARVGVEPAKVADPDGEPSRECRVCHGFFPCPKTSPQRRCPVCVKTGRSSSDEPACATCISGKANKDSFRGYECTAGCAMTCAPEISAENYKAKEEA